MIALKISALVVTFFSVYKIITFYGGGKKREVEELITFSKVLQSLYIEINTFSTPILMAMDKATKNHYKYNILNTHFRKQLEKDIGDIDFVFIEAVKFNSKIFNFSKENIKLLYELSKIFVTLDRASLEGHIIFLKNQVEKEISFLEKQSREDENLFKKLSLLGALAVVVILI